MFTAPTFYHLTVSFLGLGGVKKEKRLTLLFYGIMLAIAPFSMTSKYFLAGAYKYFWGYYSKAGLLHPIYLIIFFSIFIKAFLLLYSGYKKRKYMSPLKSNQIKYIFIAYVIALTGAVDYIPKYGVEFYPFGFISEFVFALIVAYAIIKYRLMDINIVIGKLATYSFLLIIISGVCLGLMWGVDRIFSTLLPAYSPFVPHFLIFLLLSIALIYLIPRIKRRTEDKIDKMFFKNKFQYREAVREFSKRLVLIPGEEQLLTESVNNIATAMGVSKVAIMLMDDLSGNYIVQASSGLDEQAKKLVLTPQDGIIKWLTENKKVFFVEEIDKILSIEEVEKIKIGLKDIEALIYLPLTIHNELGGILALGEKLSREMFSHIDIELLEGFTNQLALSISYKRLESQIVRADRLVSLGTLAAGMAHEIRNPLSSIQTFAQLLPEKYNDREFREEFSKIVASDTQRISRIIESVMALANPRPHIPVSCNANELLDKALFIIEGELKKDGVKVTKNYAAQLPQIKADKEQLQQVFLNIFLNALAALSKNDGKLTISTLTISTRQKLIPSVLSGQEEKYVQIEIKDNGTGIEKKLLDRIFEPFFTTRPEGTGLGLAIVHRIIEQHRGFIKVDSAIGKGTTFLINLPCGGGK
jgi:two-component system nitrogen regulation sensor histidine kinase GlnL